MIPDIGDDDKLCISSSVCMYVGDWYIDILGLGVRLEFDYDVKVGMNGGNVVGIYDDNGSVKGGIWLCTNCGNGFGTDDGDWVGINNGCKVSTNNFNGEDIGDW